MAAPNFWTSTRGTKINTTGLQGNQLRRIQNLANSGYGTKATQLANTLQARIPKTMPTTPVGGAQPIRTALAPQGAAPQNNAWIPENKPITPVTGGGQPVNPIQTINPAAPRNPAAQQGGKFFTSTLGTKINVAGLNPNQLKKIQQLANSGYGTKATQLAKTLQSRISKVAPTVEQAPVPAGPPQVMPNETGDIGPNTAGTPPAAPPTNPDNTNALFPTATMFEKGFAGDPLYDWQVKQGLEQVDKSLAARGLTNSGAGIKAELQVPQQAAALATDRMQQLATNNADRLYNIQQNEANRLYNQGNDQWNHALSLAQLMAAQSPYDSALAGLNNTASLTQNQAKAQANYLAQAYKKVFGGGGGGAAPVPIPVPTGGPDYSNIMPTQIAGNTSSNNGWLNLLTGGLASILPAAKAGA